MKYYAYQKYSIIYSKLYLWEGDEKITQVVNSNINSYGNFTNNI